MLSASVIPTCWLSQACTLLCTARRASTGGEEWKEQLSGLSLGGASKELSSRKRRRVQTDLDSVKAEDSFSGETVEDVFSLDTGWSVEVLGDDEDDASMIIGDEVKLLYSSKH